MRWTLVVRAETEADDRALIEDGEAHDPAPCWGVFIDPERMRLTVAVPPTPAEHPLHTFHAAGFLIELLCEVADPRELIRVGSGKANATKTACREVHRSGTAAPASPHGTRPPALSYLWHIGCVEPAVRIVPA